MFHYPWLPLKEGEEWDAFSITGYVMYRLQAPPDDQRVQAAIRDLHAHLGMPPEVFNDAPATTLEDVHAALRVIGYEPG